MEKMHWQPQRGPSSAPLARDQFGNPIELPDGAVGWRIRRRTGGRPRLVLDSKKQVMLFPLDYSITDVEDIVPPGNYLLDAVDRTGEPLGLTIGLSIGGARSAEPIEPDHESDAPAMVAPAPPNPMSEMRLVLEASARATQMALAHSQRTLEVGLRIAETLRDSVRALASSQAELIRSISSSRGFLRGAGRPPAPVDAGPLAATAGVSDEDPERDGRDGAPGEGGGSDEGDAGAPGPR
jgi:hypothetical protein